MIRLIAVAGLALALAPSAYAMPRAPLQSDSLITQVREGCGPGRIRVNGICVARTTLRQVRRGDYRDGGYRDGGTYVGGGNRAAFGTVGAGDAGRPTYEQAWARCKVFVDTLPRDAQSQRYSRGAACMHQYGYRL